MMAPFVALGCNARARARARAVLYAAFCTQATVRCRSPGDQQAQAPAAICTPGSQPRCISSSGLKRSTMEWQERLRHGLRTAMPVASSCASMQPAAHMSGASGRTGAVAARPRHTPGHVAAANAESTSGAIAAGEPRRTVGKFSPAGETVARQLRPLCFGKESTRMSRHGSVHGVSEQAWGQHALWQQHPGAKSWACTASQPAVYPHMCSSAARRAWLEAGCKAQVDEAHDRRCGGRREAEQAVGGLEVEVHNAPVVQGLQRLRTARTRKLNIRVLQHQCGQQIANPVPLCWCRRRTCDMHDTAGSRPLRDRL